MPATLSSFNPIYFVLLAGSRPGIDPLAQAAGVPTKALVPVAGRPMLDRVARTLVEYGAVAGVVILSQQGEAGLAIDPQTRWLADHPKIRFVESGQGISQSLLDLIDGGQITLPAIVTTADNVLMDGRVIDAFLARLDRRADVAVAMVERRTLMAAYPQSRRTWLKFRGGWWSGANLFWLGSERARGALALWRTVEQDRKKGWKILSVFGPALLLGAGLRLLTIHAAISRAGKRLGLAAQIVPLPIAEACIDADKPEDIVLIERILAEREI